MNGWSLDVAETRSAYLFSKGIPLRSGEGLSKATILYFYVSRGGRGGGGVRKEGRRMGGGGGEGGKRYDHENAHTVGILILYWAFFIKNNGDR